MTHANGLKSVVSHDYGNEINEMLDNGFLLDESIKLLEQKEKIRRMKLLKKESITMKFEDYGIYPINSWRKSYYTRIPYINYSHCPYCDTDSCFRSGKVYDIHKNLIGQRYRCLHCGKRHSKSNKRVRIRKGQKLALIISCFLEGKSTRKTAEIFSEKFNQKIHHSTIHRQLIKTKVYQKFVNKKEGLQESGILPTIL